MLFFSCTGIARGQAPTSDAPWVSDLGNGQYQNPVLYADYSDPDVCRVGEDFYMTASSFQYAPGLPILHSRDLVNWRVITYALPRQIPEDIFQSPQPGKGVWAPSIRHHDGYFYIYYPDPDFGIYMIRSRQAVGPWSAPVLVKAGKGFIDPAPLWDDDGQVYLVHAFAGSRAGIKSILVISKMNTEGTAVLDDGVMVFDGHDAHPTVEGPKLYKRKGYYYIFAPAGGVATGWQLVLRAKQIYGPYEARVVMDQGKGAINGPHQGAWVDTRHGSDWFIHFQDKGVYGRVVHLQPMRWRDDWPIIGLDPDNDGKGEPVLKYQKPVAGQPIAVPEVGDEFDRVTLGTAWQWQANSQPTWAFPTTQGFLRLNTSSWPKIARSLWDVPSVLVQKFPAPSFIATVKAQVLLRQDGERFGLVVTGLDYATVYVERQQGVLFLKMARCRSADTGTTEDVLVSQPLSTSTMIYLRVAVKEGGSCQFSTSVDGMLFINMGPLFQAREGKWVGARVGLYAIRQQQTNDSGYANVDWFRITRPSTE